MKYLILLTAQLVSLNIQAQTPILNNHPPRQAQKPVVKPIELKPDLAAKVDGIVAVTYNKETSLHSIILNYTVFNKSAVRVDSAQLGALVKHISTNTVREHYQGCGLFPIVGPIEANSSISGTVMFTKENLRHLSAYPILIQIDYFNKIKESNEQNNISEAVTFTTPELY